MKKTAIDVAWTALDKVSLQIINFVVFLVLARLLGPEDFGLVALSSVFVAFFQLFIDQGMAQAIIQFPDIDSKYLDTAFWIGIFTGVILAVTGVLLSGLIADFFKEPGLKPVIMWLSCSFVLLAFSSVQQATLQRNLEFKKLAIRSMIAKLASGITGIVMALYGFGVWSLVGQTLAFSLTESVVLWTVSPWRPGWGFSVIYMKKLMNFGVNTLGVRILDFFDFRFDDLIIGYFLGTVALGYYTIAFRMLRLLMDFMASIPGSVIFPTLSRLQHSMPEFKQSFRTIVKYANLVIWPGFLAVFILSESIIQVIFGPQWSPSTPVLRLLVLGGVIICSFQFNGSVLWALGKADYIFRMRLMIAIFRTAAYLIVVQFGIFYIAATYLMVALLVFLPLYTNILRKFLDFSFWQILDIYARPAIASLFMGILMALALPVLNGLVENMYLHLGLMVVFGFTVYLIAILIVWPDLARQARSYLGNYLDRARTS